MYVENIDLFRDIATKGAYVKYWTVDISVFNISQFLIIVDSYRRLTWALVTWNHDSTQFTSLLCIFNGT